MDFNYYKHPRIPHLPWSKGYSEDDDVLYDTRFFENKKVVISIKMDGENTSIYWDGHNHARSLDSRHHPSQSWVKQLHASIQWKIPEGWRICGENLYAKHTIHYKNLDSYFYVFSVWNEKNECLKWKDTEEFCALLNLKTVPIIYNGMWNEDVIKNICPATYNGDLVEGYVVRFDELFNYADFNHCVAKYVKQEFKKRLKESPDFWRNRPVIPNIMSIKNDTSVT